MKHNLEFKDFESSEKSRKQIEDLIKRLDKKTRIFSPEEIFLRLKVEHNVVARSCRSRAEYDVRASRRDDKGDEKAAQDA